MSAPIAERRLLFAPKGSSDRREFFVRVGAPYAVEAGSVNFSVDEGVAACSVSFDGVGDGEPHHIYGADSVQALELAVSMIEPFLEQLSKNYDIYFPTGENYFETDKT
jgi:hypothetical protein